MASLASAPLKVNYGDITVTKPGTVISGLDIRGRIIVKADNVTIRDCVVRGGAALTSTSALITAWFGTKGLVIQDTTIRPDKPSAHTIGIGGWGFTAERVDISRVVDGVQVSGSNVVIRNSTIHDLHITASTTQPDRVTHSDDIQVEGGNNILITGNRLSGANVAALMVTQNAGRVSNLRVQSNQLGDGGCTINVDEKGKGPISMTITSNTFRPGGYGTTCPMRLPRSSSITVGSNVWVGSLAVAKPLYF